MWQGGVDSRLRPPKFLTRETMIVKELGFVYICSDGKKFLLKEQAEQHEEKLKGEGYKLFNR